MTRFYHIFSHLMKSIPKSSPSSACFSNNMDCFAAQIEDQGTETEGKMKALPHHSA